MAAHIRLSFALSNTVPDGATYNVRWDGQVASNGDGAPVESPAPPYGVLSGARPLWVFGKAGVGNEACGAGHCGIHENYGPGRGCGLGPCGVGECGLNAELAEFCTDEVLPALRDGTYAFYVEMVGPYGAVSASMAEQSVEVAGPPRPPANVRFTGWNGTNETIGLAWTASPDVS